MAFDVNFRQVVAECFPGPVSAAELSGRFRDQALENDGPDAIVPDATFRAQTLPWALSALAKLGWLSQERGTDGSPRYAATAEQAEKAKQDPALAVRLRDAVEYDLGKTWQSRDGIGLVVQNRPGDSRLTITQPDGAAYTIVTVNGNMSQADEAKARDVLDAGGRSLLAAGTTALVDALKRAGLPL